MTNITILGGTGYAGGAIAAEAARRGRRVVAISRSAPAEPTPGVEYRQVDLTAPHARAAAVAGADVVVCALSTRGVLVEPGALRGVAREVARLAQAAGVRFGVIGGAGSALVADGGSRLMDTPGFPEAFMPAANELAAVLRDLRVSDPRLDWFYVSPAAEFGAWSPGEATGRYRIGGDSLVVDDQGASRISAADLALAVVDEIESPKHRRERFTVAY